MRYFVEYNSFFDTHPYNRPKIAKGVRAGGGKNIRSCRNMGWRNLPQVVTFDATPSQVRSVEREVERELSAGGRIHIQQKYW